MSKSAMGWQAIATMTPGHYFDAQPVSSAKPRRVPLVLPDLVLELRTDSGVFSPEHIDPGTRLLLAEGPSSLHTRDGDHAPVVVDLGCGYGPIACVLARRHPLADVWAVDVNERARHLCAENAAVNGCVNVRVVAPEQVPADLAFDEIWSNPPIRIGKAALHELLTTWAARLAPHGRMVLVVHRHLGADSLAQWLTTLGLHVERRVSRQGYRVLDAHYEGPGQLVNPRPGGAA
jgi:16S rRNA (guanine1207-N2)-methyltransferase